MNEQEKQEVVWDDRKADVKYDEKPKEKGSLVDRFNAFGMAVTTAVLISGAITFAIAAYSFNKIESIKPVSVDIEKIIVEEITQTSKMTLDAKTGEARGANFSRALEKALDAASDDGKRLVLVGHASLRGAKDVTAEVMASVKKSLSGG